MALVGELLEVLDALMGVFLGGDEHLLALLLDVFDNDFFLLDLVDHLLVLFGDLVVFMSQVSQFFELCLKLTAVQAVRCLVL